MTRASEALCLVILTLVTACDDSPRSTTQGTGSDSHAPLVQNSPPYPVWQVDRASAVRIGAGLEGDESAQFADIRYAATLSDGRIVVVDGGSSEVRWFSEDGTFATRAGGRGEGPGELSHVKSGALLEGDTLVLFDSRNRRLTWFDENGGVAGTRRLDLGLSLGVTLHGLERGRLLVAVESPNHNFGGSEYNHARDSAFAVVVSDATAPDTVLRLAGNESVTWVDYVDGRARGTRQMELPFGHRIMLAGVGEFIVVARSDGGDLDFLGLDGRTVHRARRSDLDPPRVSPEVRQRYVESAVELAKARGLRVGPAREAAAERLELLPEGRTVPVYDHLLIDPIAGRIWLRDFMPPWSRDDPRSWTVHDERGRVLARLTTPPGFEPMHVAEDRLTGVSRDRVGVEYVTVYRLGRTSP